MTSEAFDQAKADTFGNRMLRVLNDSFLGLMCSVGHHTGLFDTMANLAPSTSGQIASASQLNERYVREWLGAMVTGGVVDYRPGDATYILPPEHAQSITRTAGADNIAFYTAYLSVLGSTENQLIECFRNGGGVPYSSFPGFQPLQAEETAMGHEATLIDSILPLVPGIVPRLQSGIQVADIGCGQGHSLLMMAQAFPNSKFTGYDLSETGIAAARAEAGSLGVSNASFELVDVATLRGRTQYDLITTFDVVHDLAQPAVVLKAIADLLNPGGAYLMVEFAASSNLEENMENILGPTLYAISVMYCMTTSLAYEGAGLGTMWGEQLARQYLADAGFGEVQVKQMEGDPLHNYFIASKG
ncbi:MAG: transcriptional regulator [SAR202 cluster bacterium Io17-Chloro-G9]|nr:MAG: transcriptional regulator [SAR202 cluster bacterium Io17-Chloro-G9]